MIRAPPRRQARQNGNSKRSRTNARLTSRSSNNIPRSVASKTFVNAGAGFPKQMKITHRYCDTFGLDSTSGTLGIVRFACNGMFDPDLTGVGHQPYYFDQLGALYNHYHVIGSKIKVTVVAATPTSVVRPVNVCLCRNDDSIPYNTTIAMRERNEAQFGMLQPTADSKVSLMMDWSAKKMFGGGIMANDSLKGTTSANPSELTEYHLCVETVDQVSTSSLTVQLVIEYIAIWNELKDVSIS